MKWIYGLKGAVKARIYGIVFNIVKRNPVSLISNQALGIPHPGS